MTTDDETKKKLAAVKDAFSVILHSGWVDEVIEYEGKAALVFKHELDFLMHINPDPHSGTA